MIGVYQANAMVKVAELSEISVQEIKEALAEKKVGVGRELYPILCDQPMAPAVNAEESDRNLRQIIFASVVSPISVVVQSDVTQDNESAFGLDLLPLTERDDPLKLTVRITCQIDLVFRMQQLTHISVYFFNGV